MPLSACHLLHAVGKHSYDGLTHWDVFWKQLKTLDALIMVKSRWDRVLATCVPNSFCISRGFYKQPITHALSHACRSAGQPAMDLGGDEAAAPEGVHENMEKGVQGSEGEFITVVNVFPLSPFIKFESRKCVSSCAPLEAHV